MWQSERRQLPRSALRGFTLIEVLLALTLTAVVLSVTGQIAVNVVITRSAVGEVVTQLTREAAVFERLHTDLSNLQHGVAGDKGAVTVFGSPQQVLQLTALSAIPSPTGALHVSKRPATLRYRLVDGDLVRELIDRTTAGAKPLRETVAIGVSKLNIKLRYNGGWSKTPTGGEQDAIEAVRIAVVWLDTKESVSRTFVLRDES